VDIKLGLRGLVVGRQTSSTGQPSPAYRPPSAISAQGAVITTQASGICSPVRRVMGPISCVVPELTQAEAFDGTMHEVKARLLKSAYGKETTGGVSFD
jgi:hypothetical protein